VRALRYFYMTSAGDALVIALGAAIVGALIALAVATLDPTARPHLCAEVAGASLRLEGLGAYRVYANGTTLSVAPGACWWAAEVPLRGDAVEVRAVGARNATFYAVRLPNGTYALEGGARRLCAG